MRHAALAAGRSGAPLSPPVSLAAADGVLSPSREVVVLVELGNGEGRSRMIGVDLSYDYVKINAEYST